MSIRYYLFSVIASLALLLPTGCVQDASEGEGEGLGVGEEADVGGSSSPDAVAPPARDAGSATDGRSSSTDTSGSDVTADRGGGDEPDTSDGVADTSAPKDSMGGRDASTSNNDTYRLDTSAPDTSPPPRDVRPNPDALPSQFGPGSFVTELEITSSSAIGGLFGLTSQFGLDPNTVIDRRIQSGELVYLFEYEGWTKLKNDASLTLYTHPGRDANLNNGFQPNLDGNGTFEIETASYGANGQPRATLSNGRIQSGKLKAQGGSVQLTIPIGMGRSFGFRIQDAVVEANLDLPKGKTKPGKGVALTKGTISGRVPQKDIVRLINQALGARCSCQNDLLVPSSSNPETYTCNPNGQCSSQSIICQQCSLISNQLNGFADIDTNNNGTNDAYSFEASFEAVTAEIVGVASSP
jgi:hypothetical protein